MFDISNVQISHTTGDICVECNVQFPKGIEQVEMTIVPSEEVDKAIVGRGFSTHAVVHVFPKEHIDQDCLVREILGQMCIKPDVVSWPED